MWMQFQFQKKLLVNVYLYFIQHSQHVLESLYFHQLLSIPRISYWSASVMNDCVYWYIFVLKKELLSLLRNKTLISWLLTRPRFSKADVDIASLDPGLKVLPESRKVAAMAAVSSDPQGTWVIVNLWFTQPSSQHGSFLFQGEEVCLLMLLFLVLLLQGSPDYPTTTIKDNLSIAELNINWWEILVTSAKSTYLCHIIF